MMYQHPLKQWWRPVGLVVGFCGLLAGQAVVDAADGHPNVILVMADDLGIGDITPTNPDCQIKTPRLHQLAEEGITFTDAHTTSSVCTPTRYGLLTGRYNWRSRLARGVLSGRSEHLIPADRPTLGHLLQAAGYHTAMIGKWHLGLTTPDRPVDRGFDYFKGFLGDMMDDYYHHRRHGINYLRENEQVISPEGHATDLFSDWASDYIGSRTVSNAPFFLYLAYNAPHTPIQPPEEWVERVKAREPGMSEKRARLVALIEHMDAGIGRVVDALAQHGYADDTLVIFSSDNGGQLSVGADNGPLRDGKGTTYEGGLRVPTIAVWPDVIAAGVTSTAQSISMDLHPTLLAAAGITPTHELDGISLLPSLLGEPQPGTERDLFFIRREGRLTFNGQAVEAIRRGPWKLLQNTAFSPLELYNLDDDPLETTDLSDSEPEVFQELAEALREHTRQAGKVPWTKR